MRYEGKSAVVTGAASGIGRATAVRLASEGATVLACDVNEAGLAETAALDANVTAHPLDVTDVAAGAAAIVAAVEQFGKLDLLCNVAGIAKAVHSVEVTEQLWDTMLGVNLKGMFFLSQAAIPHLLASKGAIVNVASNAGLAGLPYNAVYCASKHGVVGLTKSMAVEYARQGVRINAVCPGGVATPLTENFSMPSEAFETDWELMGRLMLVPDMSQPEEIAGFIAYIGSDDAKSIIGAALSIDGGQTAI